MTTTGKRLQVYSLREKGEKGSGTVWVKAGSAWVNRDGSINIYLDVLPLEGKLQVREAVDQREAEAPAAMPAAPRAEAR